MVSISLLTSHFIYILFFWLSLVFYLMYPLLPHWAALWQFKKYSLSSHSSIYISLGLVQFSSVANLCPTLCDPMDCCTPGFPVLHHLQEIAQTHVHWVGDAQMSSVIPFSSHLQSFPASGSFFNESSSSQQVVKVLELQLQHQSFQWVFRADFL